MKIVLIGPRGAGKSTIGRALAARAGVPFTDTDPLIVERTGRSIAELFADGTFREREREVVAQVLLAERGVVALGGGSVLWEGLDAALAGWGVVALRAGAGVLAQRIRDDAAARPSLTGAPPDKEIEFVAATRANRYAGLADFSVATDKFEEEQVVGRILEWWRRR